MQADSSILVNCDHLLTIFSPLSYSTCSLSLSLSLSLCVCLSLSLSLSLLFLVSFNSHFHHSLSLDFYRDMPVSEAMTPKDKIFMLPVSEKLSHKVSRSTSNKRLHCYLNRSLDQTVISSNIYNSIVISDELP